MKSYKKLCTEFYDLDKPSAPDEALSFLLDHLASIKEPVLEPMSGSGRFLIPLLQRGVKIEGADPSPEMLKACRESCARKGLVPVLYEDFLESMIFQRTYGLIFILAGSFGLITDQHMMATSLEKLFRYLTPNGKLIVEIETPSGKASGLQEWHCRSVNRPDGAQIVCRSQGNYDPHEKTNRVACEYQLMKDGLIIEEESEELLIRYYTLHEFRDVLSNVGFSGIVCVRPYDHTNATENDESAVFICQKA